MLERKAASLGKVEPAPKLEAVLLFLLSALLASAQAAPCPQVPAGEAALRPHTPWEKRSGADGWVGGLGGRAGAWETLHKGLPNDFAPVMQGAFCEGTGWVFAVGLFA